MSTKSPIAVIVVVAIALSIGACATVETENVEDLQSDDAFPDRTTPFSGFNVVRTDGLHIAAPERWSFSRGQNVLFVRDPQSTVSASFQYSYSDRFSDTAIGPAERVGGSMMSLVYDRYNNGALKGAIWRDLHPPLLVTFNGTPDEIEAHRETLIAIVRSVRFEPYGDTLRIAEGKFGFHSFDTNWEFFSDFREGASFGWFPRSNRDSPGLTGRPEIVLTVHQGPTNENAEYYRRFDAPFGIPELGPYWSVPTTILVFDDDPFWRIVLLPKWKRDTEWVAEIQIARSVDVETITKGDLWRDPRITRFFGGCFATVP